MAFGLFLIYGSLSKILNILAAAILPIAIFYRDGPTFVKLNPAIKTLKNTTKTFPAVYLFTVIETGQLCAPITHLEPYQNPRAYDANRTKKTDAIPEDALKADETILSWV